jgi:hypothetical protein
MTQIFVVVTTQGSTFRIKADKIIDNAPGRYFVLKLGDQNVAIFALENVRACYAEDSVPDI